MNTAYRRCIPEVVVSAKDRVAGTSLENAVGTIAIVATVTFDQARQCVIAQVTVSQPTPAVEEVALLEAAGRVLSDRITADRDYPPVARSVRDGFAIRAADVPGDLRVIGEVRAGESFGGEMQAGEAIEIMTGAPVPRGADAVVMIEHVQVTGVMMTVKNHKQVFVIRTITVGGRTYAIRSERGYPLEHPGQSASATTASKGGQL